MNAARVLDKEKRIAWGHPFIKTYITQHFCRAT